MAHTHEIPCVVVEIVLELHSLYDVRKNCVAFK